MQSTELSMICVRLSCSCEHQSILVLDDDVAQSAGLFQVKLIEEECGNANYSSYDVSIRVKLGKRGTLDKKAMRIHADVLQQLKGKAPSNVLVTIHIFYKIRWEAGSTYMRIASYSVMHWAHHIEGRVARVLSGIRNECGSEDSDLNGVHLRLEGDAGPWLVSTTTDYQSQLGTVPSNEDRVRGWVHYLKKLVEYGMLAPGKPLYLSTGLFLSQSEDTFAASLMDMITTNLTAVRLFANNYSI